MMPVHVFDDLIEPLEVDLFSSLGESDIFRFCCGEMGMVDLVVDLKEKNESLMQRATAVACRAVDGLNSNTAQLIPEHAFPALFQGRSGVLYTASRLLSKSLPSLSGQDLNKVGT